MARLPTAGIGISETPEIQKAIADNVQDLIARFNEVPEEVFVRVLCSVIITICCNQDDPVSLFSVVGTNTANGIDFWMTQAAGHA